MSKKVLGARDGTGWNVAIVGATGLVGREILNVLETRGFAIQSLKLMASARSVGEEIEFRGESVSVQALTAPAFKGVDIAFFSAGSAVSREFAPLAASAGAVVIDNTSCFRMQEDIPLVVPEVNGADIAGFRRRGIIANPNCSTIQVVVAVKALADHVPLRRMVVSTYQAVSGAGAQAVEELQGQVSALFNHRDLPQAVFGRQIAFNCIPHVGTRGADGQTDEEVKMRNESRKMLHLPALQVSCTCVRVPVFNGHSAAVNLEFERAFPAEEAKAILRSAPGVLLVDDEGDFPTPADANGQDATLVGRVRQDESVAYGLNLFCAADNVRKGAATNAVQIAEILVRDYLMKTLS